MAYLEPKRHTLALLGRPTSFRMFVDKDADAWIRWPDCKHGCSDCLLRFLGTGTGRPPLVVGKTSPASGYLIFGGQGERDPSMRSLLPSRFVLR